MSRPRHLLAAWPELRARLARARRRVLLTDFDGTLARIARRPEQARLNRRTRGVLAAAAEAGDVVGVISGRRLEEVRRLVGLEGIWYAGAHGFFLRSPTGQRFTLATVAGQRRVAAATRRLRRTLRGLSGILLEPKGATVAVHYRRAGRNSRLAARKAVAQCLRPGLRLLAGKKIWELVPEQSGRTVDKWTAADFILRREGISGRGRGLVVYLGDDVTDEHVFRALPGITVAVGKRSRTAARYFLRSPGEVRRFLKLWRGLQR